MIIDLIQQVSSRYSRGIIDRSTNLRFRTIYGYMKTARSLLIYQQANKNKKISQYNYTDIHCMELETVPANLCPCAIPNGCFMLKTIKKLPKLLDSKYYNPIRFISSTDRSIFFDQVEIDQVDLYEESGNKFVKDNGIFFYSNSYLYFPSSINIKYISTSLLLNDPSKAQELSCLKGEPTAECKPAYELDFSVNPELEKAIIDMTLQSLTGYSKQLKDTRNDSK